MEEPKKLRFGVRFRSVLLVALVPFVLLGLVVSIAQIYGLVRYDPTYFAEAYVTRYNTPSAAGRALERALQTNDRALLAELQGLRWPAAFETGPNIVWVMMWERTDRYTTYLYFDMEASVPYPHYLEKVNDRWIVSPADVYYYVHSGAYRRIFVPFLLVWWASGAVTIAALVLLAPSERFRARRTDE